MLEPGDRHHLERVLRLRPGDEVVASDGAGRWRPCRFGDPLEADGPIEAVPEPAPRVTVGFALVKGERPEWAVQKLTEVGVDRIVPLVAERSVVRWSGDRAAKGLERLRRVAREAAMQSRRCWLPEVTAVTPVADLLGEPGVVLADRGGDPLGPDARTVLVGPEGGWTDGERALPVPKVGLGDHVLRTETAAVAAGVLLTVHRTRGPGG